MKTIQKLLTGIALATALHAAIAADEPSPKGATESKQPPVAAPASEKPAVAPEKLAAAPVDMDASALAEFSNALEAIRELLFEVTEGFDANARNAALLQQLRGEPGEAKPTQKPAVAPAEGKPTGPSPEKETPKRLSENA